jgi:hypothetical protein
MPDPTSPAITPATPDNIEQGLTQLAGAVGVVAAFYPPAQVASLVIALLAKIEPALASAFSAPDVTPEQLDAATAKMIASRDAFAAKLA